MRDAWKRIREKGNNTGIQFYDDAIYMGEMSASGMREGIGILLYKTSRVYEGEWI